MYDYKLILYALYFLVLDIAFAIYNDLQMFLNISLVLALISIVQDIRIFIKKIKR